MINNFAGAGGLICDEDVAYLQEIYEYLTDKSIELIFVNEEQMQELNARTRGVDKCTDVLSFPHDDSFLNEGFLGCIAICEGVAEREAAARAHSKEAEISLLFAHACLHLLGYDHECDNGEHRAREREVIEKFNLPKSLIDRTLG